jgi:hypothetical protein
MVIPFRPSAPPGPWLDVGLSKGELRALIALSITSELGSRSLSLSRPESEDGMRACHGFEWFRPCTTGERGGGNGAGEPPRRRLESGPPLLVSECGSRSCASEYLRLPGRLYAGFESPRHWNGVEIDERGEERADCGTRMDRRQRFRSRKGIET